MLPQLVINMIVIGFLNYFCCCKYYQYLKSSEIIVDFNDNSTESCDSIHLNLQRNGVVPMDNLIGNQLLNSYNFITTY